MTTLKGSTVAQHYHLPYIEAAAGWDESWQYAINQAANGTGIAVLGGAGASIMAGSGSTDPMTQAHFRLTRAAILARGIPWFGDAYAPTESAAWGWPLGTPPYVMDTAPSWSELGPWITPVHNVASGSPDLMHFTLPDSLTKDSRGRAIYGGSADAIIIDGIGTAGLTFSWNVDGNTTQTFTFAGDGKMKRVPLMSDRAYDPTVQHVIHITGNGLVGGTSGALRYVTTCVYPGANGAGTYGFGTAWWAAAGLNLHAIGRQDVMPDKLSLFQGPTVAVAPWNTGFGFPFNARGFVIDGFTDSGAPGVPLSPNGLIEWGYGPSGYRRALRRWVQALRAANVPSGDDPGGCSIEFLYPSIPDAVNSDVTTPLLADPQNWPEYFNDAVVPVAKVFNCATFAVHGWWAEHGVARGWQLVANGHPTPTGHKAIADEQGQLF